jgi:ketosteroid isomerase-like protein
MLALTIALFAAPIPADLEAFNRAFTAAVLRMDDVALLSLWEDDGVSLLPGKPPIVGKPDIRRLLEETRKLIPGAKVTVQEDNCFDAAVDGDWATEWCTTHQVVDLGAGKKPWEGRGRMLLVLHRGKDRAWRIRREMWQSAG